MKGISLILLVSLTLAASVSAGEIYGTIKQDGRPLKKTKVEIRSSNPKPYSGETDDFGNYRIIVPETGKCTITVQFNGASAKREIQSYPTPVRFNWLLEQIGNDYSLKPQ